MIQYVKIIVKVVQWRPEKSSGALCFGKEGVETTRQLVELTLYVGYCKIHLHVGAGEAERLRAARPYRGPKHKRHWSRGESRNPSPEGAKHKWDREANDGAPIGRDSGANSDISSLPAINVHPGIAVPARYDEQGFPFGICFGGLQGYEPRLIEFFYFWGVWAEADRDGLCFRAGNQSEEATHVQGLAKYNFLSSDDVTLYEPK